MFTPEHARIELIDPKQAPHLYAVLRDLCFQANIEAPIIVRPSQAMVAHQPLADWHLAAAKSIIGQPMLLLGDKAREVLNHTEIGSHVSEELKAIIAHEVKHIKYDLNVGKLLFFKSTPVLGFLAAMGGYAIYNHITKNRPTNIPESEIKNHDREQLDRHILAAKEDGMDSAFIKLAKYAAAGALGLISGVIVSKVFHSHIEYGADAYSKKLLGSGEPMAKALETLKPHIDKLTKEMPFLMKINEWIAHPTIDARISRLRT